MERARYVLRADAYYIQRPGARETGRYYLPTYIQRTSRERDDRSPRRSWSRRSPSSSSLSSASDTDDDAVHQPHRSCPKKTKTPDISRRRTIRTWRSCRRGGCQQYVTDAVDDGRRRTTKHRYTHPCTAHMSLPAIPGDVNRVPPRSSAPLQNGVCACAVWCRPPQQDGGR